MKSLRDMWPFNRNKTNPEALPQEIQQYYQSEKRERTGIAWLLAVGTLVATILLAVVLFFGGRWVYRAFTDDNDSNVADTSQEEQVEEADDSSSSQPSQSSNTQGSSTTNNSSTQSSQSGSASSGASTGTSSTSTSTPSQATSTPVTGASDLPNTGPDSDL